MRIGTSAGLLCSLGLVACSSSQQSGSEDAGETTAASSSDGSELSSSSESDLESSTDEGDEPTDCGGVTLQGEYIPPVVMYVVDTSSSMLALWDHDSDPNTPAQTRWASARELVESTAAVIGHHPEYGHLGVLGLQRFPSADANACAVAEAPEVALAQQDATALLAAVPEPNVELVALSPAAAAYASAFAHTLADPSRGVVRVMILLTDGRTNCGESLELVALIQDARDEAIPTFVIAIDEAADPALEVGPDGVPDFDPRPAMQGWALAGGTGGYYSASDPDAILQALQGPDDSPTCVIDLSRTVDGPPAPEQVEHVTWTIDGEPIPYVEPAACEDQDGWTWLVSDDLDPGVIMTFCGQACEAMKSGALIEGDYGCPDQS